MSLVRLTFNKLFVSTKPLCINKRTFLPEKPTSKEENQLHSIKTNIFKNKLTLHKRMDILTEKHYIPIVYDSSSTHKKPRFTKKWGISIITLTFIGLFFTTSIVANQQFIDYNSIQQKFLQSSPFIRVVIEDFNMPPTIVTGEGLKQSQNYESLLTQIKLKPKIHSTEINRQDFDAWIVEQTEISFQRILDNIADTNLNNMLQLYPGIQEGVIVASPSQVNPDYFYQWVRDSSITINTVVTKIQNDLNPFGIDDYERLSKLNWTYFGTVFKYFNNSYILQRTPNLSGKFSETEGGDFSGLGEPKFNVDDSAYMGNWGRPQNDGPPLRAISAINMMKILYDNKLTIKDVSNFLQKSGVIDKQSLEYMHFHNECEFFSNILSYDLKYVIQHWEDDSFDLWEEVNSKHFFTSLVQLKALKMGIEFIENDLFEIFTERDSNNFLSSNNFNVSKLFDDLNTEYGNLLSFMYFDSGYISKSKNYIIETPSILNQRSGLDIGTIIGTVLTHDEHFKNKTLTDNDFPFDVDDSGIMNTLTGLTNEMSILYPINHARLNLHLGVALGRYPEDVYNGDGTSEGNPWFLSTSTAAELCYKLVYKFFINEQDLVIPFSEFNNKNFFWDTILEVPFIINLNDYDTTLNEQNINSKYELVIKHNSPAYNATMLNLVTYGDSYLDRVRQHVADDGEMSEQMNKYTGFLQGARNLTWSYGAFWNSVQWRKHVIAIFN